MSRINQFHSKDTGKTDKRASQETGQATQEQKQRPKTIEVEQDGYTQFYEAAISASEGLSFVAEAIDNWGSQELHLSTAAKNGMLLVLNMLNEKLDSGFEVAPDPYLAGRRGQ